MNQRDAAGFGEHRIGRAELFLLFRREHAAGKHAHENAGGKNAMHLIGFHAAACEQIGKAADLIALRCGFIGQTVAEQQAAQRPRAERRQPEAQRETDKQHHADHHSADTARRRDER